MFTPFVLPPLPFDPSDVAPYLDPRVIEIHHSRHHNAYVRGANEARERIAEARAIGDYTHLVSLQRTYAFHHGGHILHSLMWKHLGAPRDTHPTGQLHTHIESAFGSFATFAHELSITAAQIQGSGWALASWDPVQHHIIINHVHDHHLGLMPTIQPFLAIDVWEHAYYTQYENKRNDYLDAYQKVIDWTSVSQSFTTIINEQKTPASFVE
jgi:Fe-Mn family superoxide dismutase